MHHRVVEADEPVVLKINATCSRVGCCWLGAVKGRYTYEDDGDLVQDIDGLLGRSLLLLALICRRRHAGSSSWGDEDENKLTVIVPRFQ